MSSLAFNAPKELQRAIKRREAQNTLKHGGTVQQGNLIAFLEEAGVVRR